MSCTIKDVASYAEVSQTTVSRVINKNGYVSEPVRQRVLNAIQELNYTPSLIASSLSKSRMKIIGVIVPDICNSFFSKIFYAASKLAEQYNYRVMLYNTDENIKLETSALQDMISYRVSGVIITPVSDEDGTNVGLLKKIQNAGVPVVFVDREMKGVNCDGVFVDNIRGAYDATARLLQEGHTKIAIVAGPQDTIPGRERFIGYRNAMEDWGVPLQQEYLVDGDFKSDKSYHGVVALLESQSPPTAIFSCNNLMTLGCVQAIRHCDMKIPDDVALIGFDEIDVLDMLGYRISVVSRATNEMGTVAMKLLLDRIERENTPLYQRIVLQSQLLVYGSEKRTRTFPSL